MTLDDKIKKDLQKYKGVVDYSKPFREMKKHNVPINERLSEHHQFLYFKESLNSSPKMQVYVSPNKDLVITTKWQEEGMMSNYQRIVSVVPTEASKDYFVGNGKVFKRDYNPEDYKGDKSE